jgi:omega-amidase
VENISIGICQLRQGYDFEENIAKALSMIDEAATRGADIMVLPEMFLTPYEPASIRSSATYVQGALNGLKEVSARLGVYIVAGSMPIDGDDKRRFNSALVFDRDGQVVFRHNKIHLFDCTPPGGPRVKESEVIMPGDTYGTFDTPWGKASVIVCYDIRFTPLAQLIADQDIQLLFVPAAFSLATGPAHWEMLVRMRSVEIQAFVVGVQPAYNPELKYVPYGHSMIASPWGDVMCDAGQDEALEVVTLDLAEVKRIRQSFPLLAHRRKDLYTTSWRRGK